MSANGFALRLGDVQVHQQTRTGDGRAYEGRVIIKTIKFDPIRTPIEAETLIAKTPWQSQWLRVKLLIANCIIVYFIKRPQLGNHRQTPLGY